MIGIKKVRYNKSYSSEAVRIYLSVLTLNIHKGVFSTQSVNLALSIFHESTIAAGKSYFPERKDISGLLSLIHTWWTIVHSRDRFCSNQLGNAGIDGDGKTDFFLSFAEWINNWSESPVFCLTPLLMH